MDIFSLITLLGGLAFFLYGMTVLSGGLERMAGGKLEGALKKITSNPLKSLLLGIGITAAIQSSSAVTVMLVGLVNSGIMSLAQSIGVIMGSNIGTTMTAWILTLVGVESDNIWMKFLKPENFSLLFAFIGILMIMGAKSSKKKDIGSILVGFAVLMYGMKLISAAVEPLSEMPVFISLFTAFKNPLLGVLAGLIVTAVLQSSSASVGILQALALGGGVTYGAAIPIIMGQNIGTCVTALLSSMGVSKQAKKVAVVHVSFNLIGTAIFLAVYCIADAVFNFTFVDKDINEIGIAFIHTIFNLLTTLLLLPFTKLLEKIANKFIPDTAQDKTELLDTRLLATPSIAIVECEALSIEMSKVALNSLNTSISILRDFDKKACDEVLKYEDILDNYEDKLGTYLVQLSSRKLSEADTVKVSKILHSIGDFERLGDHAVNIMEAATELHEKNLSFSDSAKKEVGVLSRAIEEILKLSQVSYELTSPQLAKQVEPLEQTIDDLISEIKDKHVKRLQAGACSIELGFVLSDLLNNFERISDHCSNIAVAIIELAHKSFDTHKYLNVLKNDGNEEFKDIYTQYTNKYSIAEIE